MTASPIYDSTTSPESVKEGKTTLPEHEPLKQMPPQ